MTILSKIMSLINSNETNNKNSYSIPQGNNQGCTLSNPYTIVNRLSERFLKYVFW